MTDKEMREELDPLRPDRPRGILTEADRKYLINHPDSEIQPRTHGERRARERIRQRVMHAILDFRLLAEYLEARDRDRIFRDGHDQGDGERKQMRRVSSSIADVIAFVYSHYDHPEIFAKIVKSGIELAFRYEGWRGEASVAIEAERTDPIPELPEVAKELGVSESEADHPLVQLYHQGKLTEEELKVSLESILQLNGD
jgi:hypothetical protein